MYRLYKITHNQDAYDIPQQVGYIALQYSGELDFKTTQTGTKVVYFDISYAI